MHRIKTLCGYLDKCCAFADVACDHGYFAEYMLKNNLCERAVISDISPKCLKKAETLLTKFIKEGKCSSVCCDGLEKITGCDTVMIAGIGGAEIVKILSSAYIPEKFLFQPMKNAEVLREFLIESGCKICVDDIFYADKNFYFVIKGERAGNEKYSKAQLLFGKDSLKNPVLKDYLSDEIRKKQTYLSNDMSADSRKNIEKDLQFLQGVYEGEIV